MAEIKPLRRHRRGGGRHPAKSLRPLSPPPAWPRASSPLNVALLDLGCKKNIVRCLCKRGCRVTVLPGTATAADLAALHADGLMLSNGPGDPAENVQIIQNIREMLDHRHPGFRHLPGPPADRPGRRRQDHQAEIRPPRRQPARHRVRHRPHLYHQPEPRLRGGGGHPARRCGRGQPCERQRQDLRGRRLHQMELLYRAVPPGSQRRPQGHRIPVRPALSSG